MHKKFMLTILFLAIVLGIIIFNKCTECETEMRLCNTGLLGECTQGTQTCKDGKWSECEPINEPSQEYCNKKDDDCNGIIDDECWICTPEDAKICGETDTGECEYGKQICMEGEWGVCIGAVLPMAAEICWNGLDDNCNGQTDEGCTQCKDGETRQCGFSDKGICQYGIQKCVGGKWQPDCIGAVYPQKEICGNSLDDDCDGETDEGCGVCTDGDTRQCGQTDVGACEYGTETCVSAKWGPCVGAINPVPEICGDKIDNDCDGEVDENCTITPPTTLPRCGDGTCDFFERTLDKGAPPELFTLFGLDHNIRLIDVMAPNQAIIEINNDKKTIMLKDAAVIGGLNIYMDQLLYTPAPYDWANVIVGETHSNCPQDC